MKESRTSEEIWIKRERERERDPFPNGLSSFYREISGCRCLEECVVVGVQKNV